MLPLGLLWCSHALSGLRDTYNTNNSGYFLEGFSGDDWVMKASTTSMQSSSTKEFKIGTDYCGWLDPVEAGPGWRKGDWGWLWRPLPVTLLCFLAAWGQQSPWSYALTSPQPETREPGPLNWVKINLPYLSHFLWYFVTATRTNILLLWHQDPNRDSFSIGIMFRQREIQEWSH